MFLNQIFWDCELYYFSEYVTLGYGDIVIGLTHYFLKFY